MLEYYLDSKEARGRLRSSPIREHLDGFAAELRARGYPRRSGQLLLRGAAHLGHWALVRRLPLDRVTPDVLASFIDHVPTCTCTHPFRGRREYHRSGARRLVEYLRRVGTLPLVPAPSLPPLIERFAEWMRLHRGVTASTLACYAPLVKELLAALGDDPAVYDAAQVRAFILARCACHGRARAGSMVDASRMFLRFLAVSGHVSADLVAAVPTVAAWSLSSLPRYLSEAAVEQVIAACDGATASGSRDRAIVLLLARLGLRAGDIRHLRLSDIDWSQGRLRVIGKGRRETWLPLPQDAGDAVRHYLQQGRPAIADDHVFLRRPAPSGPLASSGPVSQLVGRAIRRAGVQAPSHGAHVLRHSAATALLRHGAALETIGAVLRHRCVQSTAHYAKVDVTLLRAVAQPWPPGGPTC